MKEKRKRRKCNEKRANGKGSAVYLGDGRSKPWAARIVIGKDKFGKIIYHDLGTFIQDLDALVCLENYNKNPTPIKIKKEKYERIETFSFSAYPLVPVNKISDEITRENKKYYTFNQVFNEMKINIFPTDEECKREKEFHIRTEGKLGYRYYLQLKTAYNQAGELYDKIYKELKTSDFKSCINNMSIKPSTKTALVKLFKVMDNYAYDEEIIDRKYSEGLSYTTTIQKTRLPFTYDEIKFLWDINSNDNRIQFARDFLLIAIYTGCRAEEILFTYTKNIYLNNNYFITGLKTRAGKNRAIPIHNKIKPIFEKYYNKENEFLFMSTMGNRMHYSRYQQCLSIFKKAYPNFNEKTTHCGRHTLETELKRLNIKPTIVNSIIGHANGNIGDDIYNHITLEEKIKAINLITFEESKLYIFNANMKEKTS